MRKVVVFGTFDILHPGHLYFLKQAKKQGDYLIVVITRDERVVLEKKHKPIFNERERLKMISAIKWVNKAVLGDRAGPHTIGRHRRPLGAAIARSAVAHWCGGGEWKILKKLKPDVICVGYDQNAEWIKRCGLKKLPKIVKIKKYKNYSSSKIYE